ncbi:MAG: hypothetical protein PHE51_01575 [Eubacteriales bacterium]|nr:hypothetical protein [Eubacteriales bacterium]
MIIDSKKYLVYRCPSCNKVTLSPFNIFDLKSKGEQVINCDCEGSCVKIELKDNKVSFVVPCGSCEAYHMFKITPYEIAGKSGVQLTCPEVGLPLCGVGVEEFTDRWVDALDEAISQLYLEVEDDDYFDDPLVMFAVMDKLNELNGKGNIYCTCGCDDVDYDLSEDKVILVCCDCDSYIEVPASKDSDLIEISACDEVVIQSSIRREGRIVEFVKKNKEE